MTDQPGPYVLRWLTRVPAEIVGTPGEWHAQKLITEHGGQYMNSTGNSTPDIGAAKLFTKLSGIKSSSHDTYLCEIVPVDIVVRP